MLENECKKYVFGTIRMHFPENYVCCDFCPCLETYARKQCRLTGEYLAVTNKTIGYECPIKFESEEENK